MPDSAAWCQSISSGQLGAGGQQRKAIDWDPAGFPQGEIGAENRMGRSRLDYWVLEIISELFLIWESISEDSPLKSQKSVTMKAGRGENQKPHLSCSLLMARTPAAWVAVPSVSSFY